MTTNTQIDHALSELEEEKKKKLKEKRADLLSMEEKVLKVMFNLQSFAEERVDNFTLNEGEYNEFSKEFASQYKELKAALFYQQNTIKDLFNIIGGIRDTDWYKKNTDQPYRRLVVLTAEEKLKSDLYQACPYCDSWIKKGKAGNGVIYMKTHQMRGKCKDITLGREQSVATKRARRHASAIVVGRQLEDQLTRRAQAQADPPQEGGDPAPL